MIFKCLIAVPAGLFSAVLDTKRMYDILKEIKKRFLGHHYHRKLVYCVLKKRNLRNFIFLDRNGLEFSKTIIRNIFKVSCNWMQTHNHLVHKKH